MKTIKISEASGAALDWLAAKCEGAHFAAVFGKGAVCEERGVWVNERPHVLHADWMKWYSKCDQEDAFGHTVKIWAPSTNWAQGGLIIDREGIGFFQKKDKGYAQAAKPGAEFIQRGPTPLIAAIRCYVASKLGETAKVPAELT